MNDDISHAILPKSDQKNADDFIVGAGTFTITNVSVTDAKEQPVWVYLDNDPKPWKPCKSMLRVLGKLWGTKAGAWKGKRLTLYRDDKVTWAGAEVGGIRISHMSDIPGEQTMSLSVSKKSRHPFTVRPLEATQQKPTKKQATQEEKQAAAREKAMTILAELAKTKDVEATMKKHADMIVRLGTVDASIPVDIRNAMSARAKELSETDPPSQPALIDDDADRR